MVANEFRASRNFRKILARNDDIIGEQRNAVPTSEQYSVFRAYLDKRHRHGGMADMTVLDYAMMVEDSHVETRIIEYRKRGVDTGITGAHVDGTMVSAKGWTALAAFMRECLKVLGTEVRHAEAPAKAA